MQQPKVSILMPSLNSGEFIRECMESVVHQTLQDIEIICIDAGSTDGTLEILREYERKDPRIRVIVSDKKSMGCQYNLGLDAAAGEYIGMVETDDWIEADTFECLWMAASRQDVDIVAANQYLYYTKPEVYDQPFENLKRCPYEQIFCPKDILHSFAVKPLIWSAIYRRSMLNENGVRFNETPGASFQDTGFHFLVMTVAKTAFFLDRYFYHYRSDSETQSVNSGGKVYSICDEAHYYERFLEGRPADKSRLLKPYMAWKFDKYYWNYIRVSPQSQWEFLMRFREEFMEHQKAGLLTDNDFETSVGKLPLENIHEIINNPVSFYRRTCKKYCTFPKEGKLLEAEVLRESQTKTPCVSIIIPLCNEENRVAASVESAQKQTLENIEILCVDDGSDDSTLRLVMERAEADKRFTVLHQGNQGAASAKNRGLEYARGKYILFLCAGDRLKEDAVEKLVSLADKHCLDMLCFDSVSVNEQDNKAVNVYKLNDDKVLTGADYFCSVCEEGIYLPFACTSLYNREYLTNRNIRFLDGMFYEDRAFLFEALTKAQRVLHLNEPLYFIFDHRNLPFKSIFLRVYSYFVIYQTILRNCRLLPYGERLQKNAAGELKTVYFLLEDMYRSVNKKELCKSKFADTELCLFEKLVGHEDGSECSSN